LINLLYRLAEDPGRLEKVHAEVAAVDCSDDKILQKLPYVNGVINETLRLHPAVPRQVTGRHRKKVQQYAADSFLEKPLLLLQGIPYSNVRWTWLYMLFRTLTLQR